MRRTCSREPKNATSTSTNRLLDYKLPFILIDWHLHGWLKRRCFRVLCKLLQFQLLMRHPNRHELKSAGQPKCWGWHPLSRKSIRGNVKYVHWNNSYYSGCGSITWRRRLLHERAPVSFSAVMRWIAVPLQLRLTHDAGALRLNVEIAVCDGALGLPSC